MARITRRETPAGVWHGLAEYLVHVVGKPGGVVSPGGREAWRKEGGPPSGNHLHGLGENSHRSESGGGL
jgi:hypothetical protein